MILPKTAQLKTLTDISHYGSINAAAKALGIPQPTLSRSLKELEETIGIKLVVRGKQGVVLTEGGRIFASHASSIVKELEKAVEDARISEGYEEGTLSVGLSPVSVNSIFFDALRYLLRQFPHCGLSVETGSLEVMGERLRTGVLDLAVGNAKADISVQEFERVPLMQCPFAVVCAKGHPLENKTQIEDLQNANWWVTGEFKVCRKNNDAFRRLRIGQSLHTRSHLVGMPMVLDFGFLALLSSVQIRKYAEQVSVIPIRDLEVREEYVLLYPKSKPLTSIASRFIHLLQQGAAEYDWEHFGISAIDRRP